MAAATLTSSDDAAAMDRLRFLELLMMVVIHSLLRKEGVNDDDDDARELKDMVTECSMAIHGRGDQSAVSKELLVVTQRLLDAQLRLPDGGENMGRAMESSAASDYQLMDGAASAEKEKKAAAAKKKRNKAAAKHKGTKLRSWLGGGIISLLMMAAFGFGSITTSNVAFSLIHQSDGSSEGNAPPTLPPSTSTSLRQKDLQSSDNMASPSPSSVSPLAAVVQAPVFSPDTVLNRRRRPTETVSLTRVSTICTEDTPGWYDEKGHDCAWYEVMDVPGCPQHGSQTAHWESPAQGSANDNCCHCQNAVVSTPSPTKARSLSGKCVDTPGWVDAAGRGCGEYAEECSDQGSEGNLFGNIGTAKEHCCSCGGGSRTCEDFRSKCQDYFNDLGIKDGATLCKTAESCSCEAADDVKFVSGIVNDSNETVGLYNECKCDFWLRLCEDTGVGEACDYAAEYCCGDYMSHTDRFGADRGIFYLHGPECYCDFFNYAQNEFGHTLKSKAMNINEEFPKPCGQFYSGFKFQYVRNYVFENLKEVLKVVGLDVPILLEKPSLEAIYNETNGQNWTKSDGWMNETVNHCQWYGISCDDEGFVTSIDLRDNNLVGQFPTYSSNESLIGPIAAAFKDMWIPTLGISVGNLYKIVQRTWVLKKYGLGNLYGLKMVDLADNKLTGTIEYRPLYNLNALTHFEVSGNQLSGEVEALVTPSIRYADFSNNRFTSMRRFEKYKRSFQTLCFCDVSNNVIRKDVTDLLENVPPNIEQFIASNNLINGSLPASLNNLPKLSQFNMSSNALSGELPGFVDSILSLQELDMSNQNFTGLIPEDIWRSLSLKILNLAGNRLTGTIPRTVGNMAVVEVFDLSNNLLESSIPNELGMLEGSLKHLGLANNNLSGTIPSQIGQLQGASVFLKDNRFHNDSTAPLSLCVKRDVEEFDLASDTTLCPIERNALSDFYDSAKGAEWTDQGNKKDGSNGSLWQHEYASYCDWKGVTCNNNTKHVTKLQLSNNGLSGRLSESIGNLTFIEVLDLSDNDIKGSIPTELGLLSNITYLRLSYNAFTGAAPDVLGELTKLQLLQLQSNRITEMPIISRLDNIHGQSTFVADCGVPTAFDEALQCENCTMCCNANDDCHPQEESQVAPLNYVTLSAVLFVCFLVFCCIVTLILHKQKWRRNLGITLWMSMQRTSFEEDDEYALSKIGKNSVYSYFVTDKVFGWIAALATVLGQVGTLVVFILASEPNLQDDKSDIRYTWKCPRDTDVCKDKSDLEKGIWAIFCVLMFAFLAKDIISGFKLICHSAKRRHDRWPRIRYFFGGMILCSVTIFALYVSTVYNIAIATRNTELILNSIVVLFVMDMDEWIFAALEAANKKWTAHAGDGTIDEMKEQIANQQEELIKLRESQLQGGQIASQQEEELRKLRELVEKMENIQQSQAVVVAAAVDEVKEEIALRKAQIESQQEQIASQREELGMLRELVEKIQESQAA